MNEFFHLGAKATRYPLIITLALWVSAPSLAGGNRYAIIIGHNLGSTDEDPLRFAEQDAERFWQLLTEIGDVRAEDIRYLRAPDLAQIQEAFSDLLAKLSALGDQAKDAKVLFYFSGHGDADSLHLSKEKLLRQDLLDRLKSLPAGFKLAVIDACQTSRVMTSRGVKAAPGFDIGLMRPAHFEGVVIIQSTQTGEPAHESAALGGALFSHYWISALRGAADFDHDGKITLMEAYSFVYRNTLLHSGGTSSTIQHPSFDFDLSGAGDLVLTEPIKSESVLILPAGEQERYLIYQKPSGSVVAEIVPWAEHPVSLAVPSGRLLVQRRRRELFQAAEIELSFGGSYELSDRDFSEQPYEQIARKGGALELYPNSIGVGYLFRTDRLPSAWIYRQGLFFQYIRNVGSLSFGGSLGLGTSDYRQSLFRYKESTAELSGRLGWWTALGPFRFEFSAGPEIFLVFQDRSYVDRARLEQAGVSRPMQEENFSLGFGGGGEVALRINFSQRMEISLGGRVSLLALGVAGDNSDSWRAIPVIGAGVSLGYRL